MSTTTYIYDGRISHFIPDFSMDVLLLTGTLLLFLCHVWIKTPSCL